MNDKKSFGYFVGQIFGAILVACIGICLAAILIAGTIKFIGWIF